MYVSLCYSQMSQRRDMKCLLASRTAQLGESRRECGPGRPKRFALHLPSRTVTVSTGTYQRDRPVKTGSAY
jgi:hypothetical protein